MVYTDIQTLRGLLTPFDYGSGVEYANGLVGSLFQNQHVGLQIGLWLKGTSGCHDIVNGVLDNQVKDLVNYLISTQATKVFLRVGYEFDNPSFGYDNPALYQQAYRYLYQACHEHRHCASKTLFVWHSWAAPRSFSLESFYPGDNVVDWIGVSVFQQVYSHQNLQKDDFTGGSSLNEMKEVLDFAVTHGKPIMIAESSPFGGITNQWSHWFQPTMDLIDDYDISMWSYINCDWESQPMWHNVGFGESRLSTSPAIMEHWNEAILQPSNRTFLLAGSLLLHCTNPNIITRSNLKRTLAVTTIGFLVVAVIGLLLGWWWSKYRRPNHVVLRLGANYESIHQPAVANERN